MACNKEKRKIYASYCRKDDAAKSVIDALIEKASHAGCTICYDGNALSLGSSITKFMAELSEADRIVFLLSKRIFNPGPV